MVNRLSNDLMKAYFSTTAGRASVASAESEEEELPEIDDAIVANLSELVLMEP